MFDSPFNMSECPLCCEDLTEADKLYVLHCPTVTCNFNYCSNCIQSMRKSAADGYQEASDGSKQLKVHVQCPQCRGKYECQTFPSQVIVEAVLLLRQAHSIQESLQQKDSELNATVLGSRDTFLHETSVEDLEDAVRRLSVYQQEIGIDDPIQPLEMDLWKKHLLATSSSSGGGGASGKLSSADSAPWVDPSLFLGLEELMSRDEQEFVTSLLTAGKPELLQQAAHILYGVLNVSLLKNAEQAVRQLSSFAPTGYPPVDVHKIRKRWPLPSRMPRCVALPIDVPGGVRGPTNFKFKKNHGLTLATVRGPAGKAGLRVNDAITHVNGEPVETVEMFQDTMMHLYNEDRDGSVFIVVNADMETAEALKLRADEMIRHRDKVKQQKHGGQ